MLSMCLPPAASLFFAGSGFRVSVKQTGGTTAIRESGPPAFQFPNAGAVQLFTTPAIQVKSYQSYPLCRTVKVLQLVDRQIERRIVGQNFSDNPSEFKKGDYRL